MKDIFSPSQGAADDSMQSGEPIPVPEIDFDFSMLDDMGKTEDPDPGFYGSYGEAVSQPEPAAEVPAAAGESSVESDETFAPVLDFPVEPVNIPEMTDDSSAPFTLPEEDLVIPDIPAPASDPTRTTKKSLGYETTVKIKNARHAEKNEKRINEPIKKDARPTFVPKEREFSGIASGTAHVSGGLPELRDDQMYVAVTPKELRLLKSRKFRGLGVFSALCLAVIAAFCIWSYANSFADPLVGRWKGNISSVALGIDALKDISQDSMDSTWEFSSSGTLYINLVVKETPLSISGSYVKKTDKNGEQYISMTLKSPMDNQDYTVEMYYTVTGSILQFNDMDGVGAEIDLTKE